MIHQIILSRLHIRRRGKVHAIRLARGLDLLPRARQPNHIGMELGEIFLHDGRRVARGIARDDDGEQDVGAVGPVAHPVDHVGHLVELFGADVGAVGEAKVDLWKARWHTR